MNKRQVIYLVLAVVGALSTWFFNVQFMIETGWWGEPLAFIEAGMINNASSSLTMDILFAAATGFTWMVFESHKLGMKNVWIYIALGFFVAFAFAFPLFLFYREKHLVQAATV